MTHAIPYRRYSSASQASGSSEFRQDLGFDQFLQTSRLVASPFAYFDKGESAYHGDHRNAEFGRLLSDCEARKFPKESVVWFEDMDRFGRGKLYVVLGDWEKIIGAGYKIHVGSLGQTFDHTTGEMEKIGAIMKAILAHEESEKKSVRGKVNRQRIRETGLTKKGRRLAACPFWLTVGDDGQYHVVEEQADLIRRAMRLALTHGCQEISRLLGNPKRTIKRRGKMVEADLDILGVLRNRAIVGEFLPTVRTGKSARKELAPKPNHYPSIDTDNIFNQVQTALDSRRTMRGRKGKFITNLFTELCHGSDGLTMYVKAEGRGRVLKRRSSPEYGEYRTWNYQAIETALLRFLSELQLTQTYNSPVDALTAELQQVEKKLGVIKGRMAGDDNLDELLDMVSGLSAKKKELVGKIEAEKGRVPEVASLRQTQEILSALGKASGDDLLELRGRLKATIRRLVARVDCTFLQRDNGKVCQLVVHLANGETRNIHLADSKRKKVGYAHVCDGAGTTEVWTVRA